MSGGVASSQQAFSIRGLVKVVGLTTVFGLIVFVNFDDIARAYPSRERLENVHELPLPVDIAERLASTGGDFDGDGYVDELTSDYWHVEPLFGLTTSQIVEVRSGSTNELLFARLRDFSFSPAHWCGDVDGNGTDDVYVFDDGRQLVLGFSRP